MFSGRVISVFLSVVHHRWRDSDYCDTARYCLPKDSLRDALLSSMRSWRAVCL